MRAVMIDYFPLFLALWKEARGLGQAGILAAWAEAYSSECPDLWAKLVADYTEQGAAWQAITAEHVLPYLDERLPAMKRAHTLLPGICREVTGVVEQIVDLDMATVCLTYVGLGNGAGWVTRYQDQPAILFGLENIAEEGWANEKALRGLAAHELGHLVHFEWRERAGLAKGEGAWWQLYTEGFAQFCEGLFLGEASWHMQKEEDGEWLAWCQANRGRLAALFLQAAEGEGDLRPFFGSWFDIEGRKQTGYYLGYEVIRELAGDKALYELALLEDFEAVIRPVVERL